MAWNSHDATLTVAGICFEVEVQSHLGFHRDLRPIGVKNGFVVRDNHIGFEDGNVAVVGTSKVEKVSDFGE